MTDELSAHMKSLGWEFMPTGPNEGEWLKFTSAGFLLAQGGSETWKKDIEEMK